MNEDDGEFDCNVSGTMGSAANAKVDKGMVDQYIYRNRKT